MLCSVEVCYVEHKMRDAKLSVYLCVPQGYDTQSELVFW